MTDAWNAAGYAGERSPNHAKGVAVIVGVYFHLDPKLILGLNFLHL
jgi:hypothetical protein